LTPILMTSPTLPALLATQFVTAIQGVAVAACALMVPGVVDRLTVPVEPA